VPPAIYKEEEDKIDQKSTLSAVRETELPQSVANQAVFW